MKREINYQYWFMDIVLDEKKEYGYFTSVNMNGLFRWDFHKNEVHYLKKFSDVGFKNELYSSGIICGHKLYFPPRMSNRMAIYNIETNHLAMKDLYSSNPFYGIDFQGSVYGYTSIHEEGDYIYFIYRESPLCIKWNITNDTCTYITCDETSRKIILTKDYVVNDHICYIPATNSNVVLVLDMQKDSITIQKVGNDENWKFGSIIMKNNSFWLLRVDQFAMVEWSRSNNQVRIYNKLEDSEPHAYSNSYKLLNENGLIWLIPALTLSTKSDDIISFDSISGDIKRYNVFSKYTGMKKWPIFSLENKYGYALFKMDEDLYKPSSIQFVYLDFEQLEVRALVLPIPKELSAHAISEEIDVYQKNIVFEKTFQSGTLITEQDGYELEDFLNYIQTPNLEQTFFDPEVECGTAIYEHIKKNLLNL